MFLHTGAAGAAAQAGLADPPAHGVRRHLPPPGTRPGRREACGRGAAHRGETPRLESGPSCEITRRGEGRGPSAVTARNAISIPKPKSISISSAWRDCPSGPRARLLVEPGTDGRTRQPRWWVGGGGWWWWGVGVVGVGSCGGDAGRGGRRRRDWFSACQPRQSCSQRH